MAQIKNILVPTDFSENAYSVNKLVRKTAKKYGAKVDFIHIIHRPHYFNITRDDLGNPFEDKDSYSQLREKIIERLETLLHDEIPEQNRGKAIVLNNERPAVAIGEYAESEPYDLVILASRGFHQSMFVRGSVTEKLIKITPVPVLSVNNGYDPKINTVIVPTDGSQVSLEALPMALLIAAQNNARIQLLGISKVEGVAIKVAGESIYKYTDRELKQRIISALREFVTTSSNGLAFVNEPDVDEESFAMLNDLEEEVTLQIKIEKGVSVHGTIVAYAKDEAQLVVIATHGRSKMASLFLGSVTEKVVRHLRLPVMTVKPDFAKKTGK